MLWRNSQFLFFFFCLMFYLVHAEIECNAGEMAAASRDKCVPCPEQQYRPTPSKYRECLNCLPCAEFKYSKERSSCTPTSNAVCQCFEGFSPLEDTHEACECSKGSGIKTANRMKVCEICPNGTFTITANSECQPWTRCDQSGVEVPGSSTSDVTCRNAVKEDKNKVMPTIVSISTTTSALTTTDNHRRSIYLYTTTFPANSKQPGLWLGVFASVLVLFLIICTIVKLNTCKFFQRKDNRMDRQDSACGKPVEESGKGFSSVI